MKIEQPLSEKEHELLNEDLARLNRKRNFQIRSLVGWTILIGFAEAIIYFVLNVKTGFNLPIAAGIVLVWIGVWNFLTISGKQRRERKNIDFVKTSDTMILIKVSSQEYAELTEIEGEGFFYLFQLADNKVLSFGGKGFYPNNLFPNDNFEIAICYGPKKEIVLLEKYIYGKKLLPKIIFTGSKKTDLLYNRKYPNPDRFTIIEGRIEEIEKAILG